MSGASVDKYSKRKQRTKTKHERIRLMVNEKYMIERKRIDDVEQEVAEFWGIAVRTVQDILRST